MKGMAFIDVAVLVVYLASMVAMGVWFGRKNNTPDQWNTKGQVRMAVS
jgi:Na+/proline symporter